MAKNTGGSFEGTGSYKFNKFRIYENMFSWDLNKAIINFKKHGVSFEEAATVFDDAEALDWKDLKHSGRELRHKRLGLSNDENILMVVYTIRRLGNAKETIRIISARQASRKEREAYAG